MLKKYKNRVKFGQNNKKKSLYWIDQVVKI